MEQAERFASAEQRIRQIADAADDLYVNRTSHFLLEVFRLAEEAREEGFFGQSLEALQERWDSLYRPLLPEHYEQDFLFPPYAKRKLGETLGPVLSALYADLMAGIVYGVRGNEDMLLMLAELYIDCCTEGLAGQTEEERADAVKRAMADCYTKHGQALLKESVVPMLKPDEADVYHRVCLDEALLSDRRSLFRYGCYIGSNELAMAEHLDTLTKEAIRGMAETFVSGYVRGFAVTGKDIHKKKTVKVEYPVGMERMIHDAIRLFADEGLAAVFVPEAVLSCTGRGSGKRGVYAASPNRRFDYDHKDDRGLYLSGPWNEKRLSALEACLKEHEVAAAEHGGPAVIEVFGEASFTPTPETKNVTFTDEQNQLDVAYAAKSGELTNRFIPGEERSYTIISFPLPEIGTDFPEIFSEIIRINTLDYGLYRTIQQRMIDALDEGIAVRVLGAGENETDMVVRLHTLSDPQSQTNFENCVADVNIPVGEVFTSPVLEGTEGTLFVSHVYLGAYEYHNLRLTFTDGMVTDYTCDNFTDEAENRRFIEDNILYHHPTLPVGEFAIGTNTTAYRMARDYQIEGKLPILIMEKTGPHFAVGDTCYSYAEDVPMCNPDGKECIARDNACSLRRRSEDPKERESAYFHCHTDITIPFDELACITVLRADGGKTDIIRDGLFVLPGTESLNEPLLRKS